MRRPEGPSKTPQLKNVNRWHEQLTILRLPDLAKSKISKLLDSVDCCEQQSSSCRKNMTNLWCLQETPIGSYTPSLTKVNQQLVLHQSSETWPKYLELVSSKLGLTAEKITNLWCWYNTFLPWLNEMSQKYLKMSAAKSNFKVTPKTRGILTGNAYESFIQQELPMGS